MARTQTCRIALTVSTSIGAIALSSQIGAQMVADASSADASQEGGLAEIVVTAQRRSENLQNVPISITALPASALAASGITSTADLPLVTPGLTFNNAVGYALPRIRGVGTLAAGAGIENPVAIYVDGVYLAAAPSAMTALNNIEQIAVLKGPQGTLFGRNATGGLIQITTLAPSSTFGSNVTLGLGNDDTWNGGLYVTGGLLDNLSADFATYFNDQREGFGENTYNGHDIGSHEEFAVRTKVLWELTSRTSVTLSGDYAFQHADEPAFRPRYGVLPITGVLYTGGAFDVDSDVQPDLKTAQQGGSVTINQDAGAIRLVSITAYRSSSYFSRFDGDRLPLALIASTLSQHDHQLSQELQLASANDSKLKWVVGGFYFDAKSAFDPVRVVTPAAVTRINDVQGTSSLAAFGQATYPLTDTTNLTAGLRYTSELRSLEGEFQTALPAATPPPKSVDADRRYDALTWRLAIDHHFTDDLLSYISYNRGFKSGGFNPQSASGTAFDPETLDAYETGLKVDTLDRRARLNAALYYYDYKNIQVTAFLNGLSSIYNAASAKIYGTDLDLTIAPTRNLTVDIGASALHDRFGNFNDAVVSTARPTGGNVQGIGSATGNRLPLTPDWSTNLAVNYAIALPRGSAQLNATYLHSSGWYAEPDNRMKQDPYNIVNGSITWFFDTAEKYNLKFWGKNLTNTVYAVQMTTQPPSDGIVVAPGRTYGLQFGAKF